MHILVPESENFDLGDQFGHRTAWLWGDQYVHILSILSTEPPPYPISILREVQNHILGEPYCVTVRL